MKKVSLLAYLVMLLLLQSHTISAYGISGSYTDLEENSQDFNQFAGELLLIEAFSTECSHCIDYHPTLSSIHSEYGDQIQMLSLSINDDDSIEDLKTFKQDHPTSWLMGIASSDQFQEAYGIPGTPVTLLFDSEGRIASCLRGNQPQDDVEAELDAFLADPDNYQSENLDDGQCQSPSFLSSFVTSIWFPVILIIVLYYAFLLYRKRQ